MIPTYWDDIRHFKPSEFDSPDAKGSGAEHMDECTVRMLDDLREILGRPLAVTAGYRTKQHNADLGGAESSQHLLGRAADIRVANGKEIYDIVTFAIRLGFKGIGVYDAHVHLDTREQQFAVMWSGKSK